MIRKIKIYGDTVLKQVAEPVTEFDDDLKYLIDDMIATMLQAPGIGLAAPQIGVSKRIIIVTFGLEEDRNDIRPLINPEILSHGRDRDVCEEGCLSVPDYVADVERWTQIEVNAVDSEGVPLHFSIEGFTARIIQHEIDHLNGVLFVDRLSPLKKEIVRRKLRKKFIKDHISA